MIKIKFLIIFLLISSCLENKGWHKLPSAKKNLENEDHQFCISIGLDFGEDEPLKEEIYWRCRILRTKHTPRPNKIIPNDLSPDSNKSEAQLYENFSLAYEKANNARNKIFNKQGHDYCTSLGYSIDELDQVKIEEYLICRKKLINELLLIPPYRKLDYFNRPPDSYSTGFAINVREDLEIELEKKAQEKYPVCTKKFNPKSLDYKTCTDDFNLHSQCLAKIERAKILQQLQEKLSCQKKAYIRFPDSLIKDANVNKEEIEKFNILADIYHKNTLASIGIGPEDLKKFHSQDLVNEKVEPKTRDFNTKDRLYSKVEVAKLRRKFIFACDEETAPQISFYVQDLTSKCNDIILKWQDN